MADTGKYVDERLPESITSRVPTEVPVDKDSPLTFTQWLQYNNFLYTNTSDFLVRYQSYLNNWFAANNTSKEDSQLIVKQYYITLINEIVLNYSTVDEQRYLQNLDFNDSNDLALAIPFFARKIKDICLYFSALRDTAQTAVVQYNLKGSNYGIDTTLYNYFINTIGNDDLTRDILTLNLTLSTIRNNTSIEVEDVYDLYPDYYDINPLASASAYNATSDQRADYFSLNQYDVDPDLYLNTGYSILRAIISYPFYLRQLGENLLINPAVSINDVRYLKDSDYTNLVSVSSVQALNLALKAQEAEKYIGSDFYYVQTDDTGTQFLSGLLFKAESEFANVLNKRFPSVAAVPSEEFLRTAKEVGLFFKPDKMGLLNFTNFKFTPTVNLSALEPNTVYFFPDPYKYGNVSGNTKLTFKTPFKFVEDNYHNKVDFSNSFRFGDPTTDPYFQTFRAYQSREQSLNYANFGLSRYVDAQDFFTGDKKTIWANRDIFELTSSYKFPIDQRMEKLLSINKTLVQYKTDVYGNEYGLYKVTEKFTSKLIKGLIEGEETEDEGGNQFDNSNSIQTCLALDGYSYYDSVSGYNFDYTTIDAIKNYSGVILKTNTATPPSFILNETPYNLQSYVFVPETFCSDFVTNNYTCTIADGFQITQVNGTPLYDFSSDSPAYNPLDSQLYYNILADAGHSGISPDFRATFAYEADFTFVPPQTALTIYDGFAFLVNDTEPCGVAISEPQLYVEDSNFADVRLAARSSNVNETLSTFSARQTLYETRNTTYGDLYFRNSNSSTIAPLSAALSAILIKYPENVRNEVNNNIINFDLYYDTIQIETENYLIFERLIYDYDSSTIDGSNAGVNLIYRGDNKQFDKYSTIWFDEAQQELIFCKTTLYNEFSASNYKIVYPKIYSYKLLTQQLVQLYPDIKDEELSFNFLKTFSLSGKNIEVNIVEIDRPLVTFNDENNLYKITYIGRDLSDVFYIFSVLFRYIDGKLTVIKTTIYKLGSDVYNINFANPSIGDNMETYSILTSSVGSYNPNLGIFTWGDVCSV